MVYILCVMGGAMFGAGLMCLMFAASELDRMDVVFQPGQYSPTWNGAYDKEPSEDSVEVAKMLLEEGSQIPEDCVFQAEFPQGSGVYESFTTIYSTTYICHR